MGLIIPVIIGHELTKECDLIHLCGIIFYSNSDTVGAVEQISKIGLAWVIGLLHGMRYVHPCDTPPSPFYSASGAQHCCPTRICNVFLHAAQRLIKTRAVELRTWWSSAKPIALVASTHRRVKVVPTSATLAQLWSTAGSMAVVWCEDI